MAERRLLPVPDGLDGLRLDVALSRMLGYSRTAAADLVDAGLVCIEGTVQKSSAKVRGGEWLELTLADVAVPAAAPEPVDGLVVLYDGVGPYNAQNLDKALTQRLALIALARLAATRA